MLDHAYISFTYTNRSEEMADPPQVRYPRWNKEEFDVETFNRVVDFQCTSGWNTELSTDGLVKEITRTMMDGCDLAPRRIGRRPPRKAAYWWNYGIEVV